MRNRVVMVAGQSDAPLVEDDVAEIVHDLKNPLSMIALEATLLTSWLQGGDRARTDRAVTRIQENVTYLDRIVHDLLDVCAHATGCMRLDTEPLELGLLVEEVLERFSSSARARVVCDPSCPVIVDADSVRIQRVIANLVDNALRYSASGSRVFVRVLGDLDSARVEVIDNGPGISECDLPHLFERHRRGDGARHMSGSGLGLYACKRIIEAHGGRISADSILHVGSRFSFVLPR